MHYGTIFSTIFVVALTASAEAQIPLDREDRIANGRMRIVKETQSALTNFTEEVPANCASARLQNAYNVSLMGAHLLSEQGDVANIRLGGGLLLDVADAAREKGCYDVASDLYDLVVSAYGEDDFVPIRGRAEAGLAALQQARTTGAR